eukprot:GHRR01025444.1.p1 GENE.GHRR01025444.1~~GHRR01025444.1.p1  ORF type:complete len:325 (+),score=127.28 GHRR01025444.1:372-1346(+)
MPSSNTTAAVQGAKHLCDWNCVLLCGCPLQVSLQTAKSLKDDRAAEQCRDLTAVLHLLIHITQSDLSAANDLEAPAGTGTEQPANGHAASAADDAGIIAGVVLVGLNIVLPMINAELLQFPKLAQLYYSLLSYMLEVYPKAVTELPQHDFGSLMASLEWGLLSSDTVAVHCSLEGLAGLAKYQLQAVQTFGRGLAGQSAGNRSVVSHFQELLLRRLLLEETPQEIVEMAADAVLPLLLAEPASFGALSASMTAAAGARGEVRAATAVSKALSQLGSWLQQHAEQVAAAPAGERAASIVMRNATRQFRQQLSQMVADVRGLVCLR